MVDVLFFAELQELVGDEKLSFQAEGMTVKELKASALAKYNLANIDSAMIAVNEEYADEDTVLASGDIVAFIPPVSGG
ncbi:molybdopterin synthase sulfur carrier subunit [Virgibacillus halotolerans]|uniref:molybdopterin converting factor subunit 1 n=1 Tax=Virgibacillus halotolerans TaxID=1071053 RepID=UPI001961272B|nr:molybdopterin converting factor subunit 1 [Virgibacillus halotolerans]MBM7601636.1 molybdopterin synthase sulfur carrier subunit [Virgibacillus halotolerans]